MASSHSPAAKKHKRHKSERRERLESPADRPPGLKLILKVGNQATPEHQPDFQMYNSSYSVQGEDGGAGEYGAGRSHHKKSKKKKKKKDKGRERKHKHHHKEKRRRRGEETGTTEHHAPQDSPGAQHREPRTCVLRQRQERTAVQRMLDQLLGLLEKKDPQQFFAWPVTDNIAPGYSSIITQPMDFSTMRQKIEDHLYENLPDFAADFKLMCTNAMKYNHIDTIYYKASKKLLHAGSKLMQPDKLGWLLNLIPELNSDDMGFEITPELRQIKEGTGQDDHGEDSDGHAIGTTGSTGAGSTGFATGGTGCAPGTTGTGSGSTGLATVAGGTGNLQNLVTVHVESGTNKKKMPSTKFEAIQDDLTADEILVKSQIAAREAKAKLLAAKRTAPAMGFLKQRKDGTTNLNILVGGSGVIPGTRKRPVLLGQLCGKLTEGTGQVQGFREDRRNAAKPVKPLYYGAFGSYAPSYDSAFSNLSKEESDLVYQTYGSDTAVQYAESVLDFVKESDYATQLVDSLLDLLTGGDHNRTRKLLEDNKRLREEEDAVKAMLEVKPLDAVNIDVSELKSLEDVGIDMNFLDDMEDEIKISKERHELQQKLDNMCQLLQRLQQSQHERLSQPTPQHLSQCVAPSDDEMHMAEHITDNLAEMAKRVIPADVVSLAGVRKALGVTLPPHDVQEAVAPSGNGEVDLESELRQFLESETNLTQSPLRDDKTIEEILME